MFYNYDHNINKKVYPKPLFINLPPEEPTGYSNMTAVVNVKGDMIGVSGKKNNRITLYFNLFGKTDIRLIRSIRFDIVDKYHESLINTSWYTGALNPNMTFIDNQIKVDIPAEMNTLEEGLYRFKLQVNIDNEWYTVFSEKDSFIEVR